MSKTEYKYAKLLKTDLEKIRTYFQKQMQPQKGFLKNIYKFLKDMDFTRSFSEIFRTEKIKEFWKKNISYRYQDSNDTAKSNFYPTPTRIYERHLGQKK